METSNTIEFDTGLYDIQNTLPPSGVQQSYFFSNTAFYVDKIQKQGQVIDGQRLKLFVKSTEVLRGDPQIGVTAKLRFNLDISSRIDHSV